MAEKEFKLPISSVTELRKLMTAYAKSKNPSSLADVSKLTGMNSTVISANNGFLESINAIQGGNSKEATVEGKKLGLAYSNNMESEIETNLRYLLESNPFIESMITALGIKPRTSEEFQSHIAYSLGKELKGKVATGTGALVDLLLTAGVIEEKEKILYPKKNMPKGGLKEVASTETPNTKDEKDHHKTSLTKQLTGNLGSTVALNINIQLTIPETENEKVYQNFFEAMKKHLLS